MSIKSILKRLVKAAPTIIAAAGTVIVAAKEVKQAVKAPHDKKPDAPA
jgi:hypothetical protein